MTRDVIEMIVVVAIILIGHWARPGQEWAFVAIGLLVSMGYQQQSRRKP